MERHAVSILQNVGLNLTGITQLFLVYQQICIYEKWVGSRQTSPRSFTILFVLNYHALPMEYFHWYGYHLDLVFYITSLIHCLWRLQMISGMLELTMLYSFSPLSLVSEILIFILIYAMTWNRFQWGLISLLMELLWILLQIKNSIKFLLYRY